jgi:uncharacterized protein YukE
MQVSRSATKEEFGNLRIDATKDAITQTKFDELLNKLQIDDFTEDEKELFQSIIQDRSVSQYEFDSLNYEEIVKLKQLISKSDLEGNYIADSFVMFSNVTMAVFLNAPNISDDETYNKAVFNAIKKLNLSQDDSFDMVKELGGLIGEQEKREFENRLTSEQYDAGVRYKSFIGQDMQDYLTNRLSELREGYANTTDEAVKEDYRKLIKAYTQIQSEYNQLKYNNNSQLEQYTRNTKQNPIYDSEVIALYENVEEKYDQKDKDEFNKLLETLGVDDISEEDKELFIEIIKDKKISNIEMDNLSYQQMKELAKIVTRFDENGNLIKGVSASYNSKIEALFSTTRASGDDKFNEALYNTVKSMDNIIDIYNFLMPILNHINERLKAFDEDKVGLVEQDMNKVMDELIEKFYGYYDNPKYIDSKEHYENKIKQYEDFKEYYNQIKN